jgi:UDP-GlcNAc:undecaprenyl-phosphate GlcNAc-1-phosphate transferase
VPLFLSFIMALAITTACMPLLLRWAPRVGLTDQPGHRKVHATAVPRVGGIAMAAGFLIPCLLVLHPGRPVVGLLAGVAVLLVFGVWDDRADLDYRLKFLGQILAVALCMWVGGVRIETLTLDAPVELPRVLSWCLTFVFLVGVTNALNLADGLDGLAGGLAFLSLCAIAVLGVMTGNSTVTTLALIESGAILGFLRFNTHPARIFMGDGGSQMLGFSVGVLAIMVTQGEGSALSDSLPLLLLGLPIVDTLNVMVRRALAGRSPFVGDRSHLHHHLLELGFTHHEAVTLIYCIQVVLFLLAYFLRFQSDTLIVLAFAVFAAVLLGTLAWAARNCWRAHGGRAMVDSASQPRRLLSPALRIALTRGASWTMCAGMLLYAALVVAGAGHIGVDISLLSAAMLLLLFALTRFTSASSLTLFERLPAYLSVILMVYLDQTSAARAPAMAWLSTAVIAVIAAAALLRFAFSERRLEVTALDVLVVFVALVVPNLPGFVSVPPELAAGIVKAVVLLYVVEMIESMSIRRAVPRTVVAAMLGAIALRGLALLMFQVP